MTESCGETCEKIHIQLRNHEEKINPSNYEAVLKLVLVGDGACGTLASSSFHIVESFF